MELDSKPTDYGSHDKIVSVTAEEIFLGSSKEMKEKINGITEATQKHIKLVRDGIAGALKDSKITAAERRHVVKSLHAVHGMAKDDFGCYVKNLLNDVDGHSTQRHIDAVCLCFNEHVCILSHFQIHLAI